MKIADVVATFHTTTYVVRLEVVLMIESALLEIICLLLFGLVVETIIVFALIIFVIILSK